MTLDPKAVAKMAQDCTAAWSSGSAEAVASHYAADGQIAINRGEPWRGRSRAVYVWTFTGHHATTGRPLSSKGWEERELDGDLKVKASLGWYDADDYARQVEGA